MRIEVESKSEIKLKPPVFKCDKPIHPQITAPLPPTAFFWAIIGSAGSGKTSLLINLLTSRQAYCKAFERVHVIIPSHSVSSLKSNIFKNHDRMYEDLDFLTLEKIVERAKDDAEDGLNSLLVIDDMTAALKDQEIQRVFRDAIYNRRHYHLSIILLVQSYNAIPLGIRKTLSHFAMFKPRNKKEYTAIFEELIFLEKDTADRLMRYVFDCGEKYTFLFADVASGKLHKNFDLLNIED